MNKISLFPHGITTERVFRTKHGVCQFYNLSILGNLPWPAGPKSHLTEAAAGDSQFWNAGSQAAATGLYNSLPGKRTRDGSEKVTI